MSASSGEPRDRPRGERGFTLVEVLIAILLSVIAIVGITGLYRVQTRSSSFSRHNTEATALAEDRVEQLRTQQAGCVNGNDTQINAQGSSDPNGIYTRNWNIATQAGFECGVVTVTVQWTEEGNAETVTAVGQW